MAGTLSELQIAAALCEQVYNRDNLDQQLKNADIGQIVSVTPERLQFR